MDFNYSTVQFIHLITKHDTRNRIKPIDLFYLRNFYLYDLPDDVCFLQHNFSLTLIVSTRHLPQILMIQPMVVPLNYYEYNNCFSPKFDQCFRVIISAINASVNLVFSVFVLAMMDSCVYSCIYRHVNGLLFFCRFTIIICVDVSCTLMKLTLKWWQFISPHSDHLIRFMNLNKTTFILMICDDLI